MATEVDRLIVTLEARVTQFEKAMQKAVRDANKTSTQIQKSFKSVDDSFYRMGRNAAAAIGGAALAREVIRLADSYSNLDARLKLVTRTDQERINLQKQLLAIANSTRTDLTSTVTLYSRLALSSRALGLSEKEMLRITTTINKSFQLSGASASEAANGIRQLNQAIASGVLRGDEFNSTMENAPDLMQRLATSLWVPIGALRAMAEEGKLTTDLVLRGLGRVSTSIDADFAKLPRTVAGAFTQLSNELLVQVGQANNAESATTALMNAMDAMRVVMKDSAFATGLTTIARGIGDIGDAASRGIKWVGDFTNAMKGMNTRDFLINTLIAGPGGDTSMFGIPDILKHGLVGSEA